MSDQVMVLWVLAALCTVIGFAGMMLPMLPGAPILFLGILFGAWADNFQYIGLWTLLLMAVLTACTYLFEFFASALGTKRFGGSNRAMWGAALGGFIGVFDIT